MQALIEIQKEYNVQALIKIQKEYNVAKFSPLTPDGSGDDFDFAVF